MAGRSPPRRTARPSPPVSTPNRTATNSSPPPLPEGKYNVWAQALGFETSKGQVDLTATKHQDFKLAAITDPDQKIRQLPSEMLAAALPEDTEADANMKRIFHNQCTGCHTPGYPLQFKFDEAGWNKIINLMKMVQGTGEYMGPNAKPNGIMEFNRKELAAYLARARGPGATSMKFEGTEASGFGGGGAPQNTLHEIIEKLNKEINAALADPKSKARLADLGGMVLSGSPAD